MTELLFDIVTKIRAEVESNNQKLPIVKQKPEQSKWYKLANSLRSFKSWNTTIQGLSEIIGGGKQGKFWEYLVRPFNEASDREVTMRQEAFGKLQEATKKMGDSRKGKKSKVFIKSMGINLEFETRLMVAMNCGNVGNRERLKSGHNSRLESFVEGDKALNDQHINEILESLSKDELDYPALEECRVYWIEEPFPPDAVGDYAHFNSRTQLPIAAGENHYLRYQARQLLETGAVDIIQSDPSKCGGVTECKKIADMASAFRRKFAPHNSTSGVVGAACVHLLCATPNALVYEADLSPANPFRDELVPGAPVVVNGFIEPNDKPGLGIEVDEALFAKYPGISGPSVI